MAYYRKYRRLNAELKKIVKEEDSFSSIEDNSLVADTLCVKNVVSVCTNETINENIDFGVLSESDSTPKSLSLESDRSYDECDFDTVPEMHPTLDDDSGHSDDGDKDITYGLVSLSCKYNLSRSCMDDLLKLLRESGHCYLPKDSRTLLKTPREIDYKQKCGGEYIYFGIKCAVLKQLVFLPSFHLNHDSINLYINIDGLPLFKSSKVQLWPILGKFDGSNVFTIALYSGTSKPNCVTDYLDDFINEINILRIDGIHFNDKIYDVKLKAFICDAPARTFLKCIFGHTGYNACERCQVKGSRDSNRTVYNDDISYPLRKKEDFNHFLYINSHQVQLSPLVKIDDFDCIKGFILDYMHLVCLGITKRILIFLKSGPRICKLSNSQVLEISAKLISFNGKLPSDFAKQPRSLEDLLFWKATEFREFLLYLGVIVLKGIVSDAIYEHFLTFSIAMRILLSENDEFRSYYLDYANNLLVYFCKKAKFLYGNTFCVYNVHCITHVHDDVKNFGCSLNKLSSFPFENYMQTLKKYIKNSKSPIVQVAKHLSELENLHFMKNTKTLVNKVSTRFRDSLFLLEDSTFCFIEEIDGENCICDTFKNDQLVSLYKSPIDSKELNVGIIDMKKIRFCQKMLCKSKLIRKAVVLPYKNGFICMSLVHEFI